MARKTLLTAVLEPRRRSLLRTLEERGPLPVGELARGTDVSRPAISQHLAVLKEVGLVDLQSAAGRNLYSVVPDRLEEARRAIATLAAELPGDGDLPPVADPAPATTPAPPAADPDPPDLALELAVAAPPEVVFAAASTAAGQAAWLGTAEADAEAGGRFHVDLGGDAAAGTYRAVDPPSHLAFGWGQEGGGPLGPDASRVDLRLTPLDTGTLVRLEHRGLPADLHAPHLASWAYHLPRLAQAAEAAAARR